MKSYFRPQAGRSGRDGEGWWVGTYAEGGMQDTGPEPRRLVYVELNEGEKLDGGRMAEEKWCRQKEGPAWDPHTAQGCGRPH